MQQPRMITGRKRLALGVLAILLVELITVGGTYAARAHGQSPKLQLDAFAVLLLAVPPLLLPLRLRYPLQVLVFTVACALVYGLIGYPDGPIFLALGTAYFTVARLGYRAWAIGSLLVGYIGLIWLPPLVGTPGEKLGYGSVLGALAWMLVIFAAGEIVRTRARFFEQFEKSREEERQRQVADERLRIARELHDVLAHSVSLINVQAGVALHLIDERPEQAREALTNIKAASAETLREMRSVLGVLRGVDEAAPRSPAPSLSRLDSLIASASAAGLDVSSSVSGPVAALPAGVDVAAYRIVQEALTNVARHAGQSASARVVVGYADDAVTVQVDDDGAGSAPAVESPGAGAGLVGMRERVTALGGSLEARPRPGGGFRVRAVLPTGEPAR
jgi:signal transduction histidine kinase